MDRHNAGTAAHGDNDDAMDIATNENRPDLKTTKAAPATTAATDSGGSTSLAAKGSEESPFEPVIAEAKSLLESHGADFATVDALLVDLIENVDGHIAKLKEARRDKDQMAARSRGLAAKDLLTTVFPAVHKQVSAAQDASRKKIARFEKISKAAFTGKNGAQTLPNLDTVWDPQALDDRPEALNRAIARYLVRTNRFEAASIFADEANVDFPAGLKHQVIQMHEITKQLELGNPDTCLEWCRKRRHVLATLGSDLEFSLAMMKFIQILQVDSATATSDALKYFQADIRPLVINSMPCKHCDLALEKSKDAESKNTGAADDDSDKMVFEVDSKDKKEGSKIKCVLNAPGLKYSKEKFDKKEDKGEEETNEKFTLAADTPCKTLYSDKHQAKAKKLLGALVYKKKGLNKSPYANLLNEKNEAKTKFVNTYCQVVGYPSESPLVKAVLAGTLALPTIIKMSSLISAKSGIEWSQTEEFPVDLPLPADMHYHSIFACPVSKEQTTETNPPMRLNCGHVICKECVNRISKNGIHKFKCPYCPTETNLSEATRVYI